jgi:hypothetical protein
MATTKKVPPPRVRRAKSDVQEEFKQLRKEAEAARETGDAKAEEASREREEATRTAVEGIGMEEVAQRISGLNVEVSRALSGISEKLMEEVERLATVREAVGIEQRELERLHKIDVAATAIDQMVQDHEQRRQSLESEIAAQRAAWEEESRSRERERREFEENQKKTRQREIDDYEYKKTLERKKAQDKYDEEIRLQEKKNAEKQEALEKNWQQREVALKQAEQELNQLRKEAQGLPERLEKELARARQESAKEAGVKYEQELALLKKDMDAERRISELRIKALEEALARQTALLTAAEKQAEEAKRQSQEIAVKAIEGASGAKALSHVNQIAMEQAKQRSGQS